MTMPLPKTAQRRAELQAELDRLLSEARSINERSKLLHAEVFGLDLALEEANAAPAAAASEPPKVRAKKGEIEVDVRDFLSSKGTLTEEGLRSLFDHRNPDSVRAVLRRMKALGEVLETDGVYRLAQQATL